MSRFSQRILAILPGLVFLVLGALKVLDPAAFAIDIQNYRLVPWSAGAVIALYLPWLEICCGAALIFHRFYRGALIVTAALLAGFIAAYASTRLRGLDVDCGCFGHGFRTLHWPVFVMDPILLAIVLYLIAGDLRPLSPVIRAAGPAVSPPR